MSLKVACEPFIPSGSSQPYPDFSSFRDSTHKKDSSSPLSATLESPSVYVTFKVLHLVNAFRKRLTRKHTAQRTKRVSSKNIPDDFCRDFERQAFEEIDRYLGRKTSFPSNKRQTSYASKVPTVDWARATSNVATKGLSARQNIDRLLFHLNKATSFGDHTVDTVASNNSLFLQHKVSTIRSKHLNISELCALLVLVKQLLSSAVSEEGSALDCVQNETYIANLEHLLLCIGEQVLRALVRRLVQLLRQHVFECQKDQLKLVEAWFAEFPDGRHPLSTTWPWSIKPSLAVLWGVCWMFYDRVTGATVDLDKDGNLVNERGEIICPRADIMPYLDNLDNLEDNIHYQQQLHTPGLQSAREDVIDECQKRERALIFETERMQSQAFIMQSGDRRSNPPSADPPQPLLPRGGLNRRSHPSSPHRLSNTHPQPSDSSHAPGTRTPLEQAAHTGTGIAVQHTNNNLNSTAYAAAPPSSFPNSAGLPQASVSFANPVWGNYHQPDNAYSLTAAGADVWNQGLPVSYPAASGHLQQQVLPQTSIVFSGQEALPQRSRHPSTPSIRLTTDFPQQFYPQQPYDISHPYSATSDCSNTSSVPLQGNCHPHIHNQVSPSHLSPNTHAGFMALPDAGEMQTTTPPHSPHDEVVAMVGEPMSRKRSHSQISNGPPLPPSLPYSAVENHDIHSQAEEEYSPARITHKRGDPPMNDQRKYYCAISDECYGQTFDRKCEWSKHMDKHDRPYRCPDPGCAKLQGFTYSGGLLRHEREVHGKHGGPKAQLMCPHEDCKRHSGKGFTRKENLNEHLRRVHHGRTEPSHGSGGINVRESAFDALAGAQLEDGDTPSRASETILTDHEDPNAPATKRRRQHPPSDQDRADAVEDLRKHITQLEQEAAEKDSRLREMERSMAEMDRRLQEQQQWYSQQQAATAATAAAIANAAQQA